MKEIITVVTQAIVGSGVLGIWFYLVDKKIMTPDGLETFLGTSGAAVILYFFHTSKGKDVTP